MMFNIIAQDMGVSCQPYDPEKLTLSAAGAIVNAIAKQLHFPRRLPVFLDHSLGIFSLLASAGKGSVYVSPLYLIDRKDVPFTGPNDPALADLKKLQAFGCALAKKSGSLQPPKITLVDRMSLRLYLKSMENPEAVKNGLEFVLKHELGHIVLNHAARRAAYKEKLNGMLYKVINILSLGIFKMIAQLRQTRKHEREADDFACANSSAAVAKGGAYIYRIASEYPGKNLLERFAHAMFCLSCTITHSSWTTRAKRIANSQGA